MTITINHPFVSAKGDGSDATVVRPSNWNASHNLNMATSKIVGRMSAGPGLAEELSVTSYMIGLLNTADFATLAVALGLPTTGDAKLTFKLVADAGWVLANDGAIGDALSGGSTRANADTINLFTFFYNNFSDIIAPVLTSTGALTTRAAQGTATTAFGSHCRMLLPRQLGRALIVAGAGGGLTNRVLGDFSGEEAHTLVTVELPSHSHTQQGAFAGSGTGSGSISGSGSGSCSGTTNATGGLNHRHHIGGNTGAMDRTSTHSHGVTVSGGQSGSAGGLAATTTVTANNNGGGGGLFGVVTGGATINSTDINHLHSLDTYTDFIYPEVDQNLTHSHAFGGSASVSVGGSCTVTTVNVNTTISGQTATTGSGLAHNVMQPWVAWNIMIKL